MTYDDYLAERIPCTLVSEKLVRARIAHKCNCGNPINPGDAYWRRFWIVDGEATTEKICGHCDGGY
jgi:hypothetical protein